MPRPRRGSSGGRDRSDAAATTRSPASRDAAAATRIVREQRCRDRSLRSRRCRNARRATPPRYFNPLLDWLFEGNVNHQLHHALNKGHYLFVPWSHVLPKRRRADCDRYNHVFKTDFGF